ncbi:hypothetical protein PICSAR11_04005 [Mycobacterium avium subsp. paratuberculosis]|nr:hypothetical protein PICSAR113_00218 [Mycobacterium avium subsp. paratuberculosis]CAG6855083.1 hypothetical protein PICSAR102_00362 [Mycobacterium avium subsp. paratuberculosis]CAG6859173.1 hypothetical protein PICSAR119_00560 [Mycobacterium avium subsp. paratuberculosis]CAG6862793.1 hypothetical protein PICSAR10_00743 [Mycobacterium avium subsp. paratuberculosis]CAG6882177.1 hypothetical protein PICSAR120_01693 [Mycobacterium avium subsp. paratuberculosis]
MHLRHLGVAVAHRIGKGRRRSRAPEQDEPGLGRGPPIAVVAGDQDLVALRVDALHPELPAGDRKRPGQTGGETPGHVLDDVRRKDVVEQLFPRRVGLGEGDHRLLAAFQRLHAGDQVVAGRVDDPGLADHLVPQVPEVVGGDRGVVGPLRLGPDLVGHRERVLARHLRGHQQGRVHLPARAGGRVGIGHRPERAGQHQRADRRVDRGQVGEQVRVEARPDRVDAHDDLADPGRRRHRIVRRVGALRGRRRVDRARRKHQADHRNQAAEHHEHPAHSSRHADQGIEQPHSSPSDHQWFSPGPWRGPGCAPARWRPARPCAPARSPESPRRIRRPRRIPSPAPGPARAAWPASR